MPQRGKRQRSRQRGTPRIPQALFGCVLGAVLTVLAGALFCNPFLGRAVIYGSFDLPLILRSPTRVTNVVIVQVDELSREILHQPWNRPWDRRLHAQLLDRLREEGSRAVVFDLVFSEDDAPPTATPSPEEASFSTGTAEFAEAIRRHGRVVLASHLRIEESDVAEGLTLERPDPRLAEAAAAVGLVEVMEDADTTVRMLLPQLLFSNERFNSVDWEAARLEGARVTARKIPKSGDWWVNYYGSPGMIQSLSYYRALRDVPAGYFSNKVVYVGSSYKVAITGARTDTFRSPFPGGKARLDGVEVHATILWNLLTDDYLKRFSPVAEFLVICLFGALVGGLLPRLNALKATPIVIALMGLLTVAALQLYEARIWGPWLIPVAVQLPVALGWTLIYNATRSSIESSFLERSLSLYLSPKQVKRMRQQPSLLERGGSIERVSLMFTDIAGFSKIAERMDPGGLVALLNAYYDEAIHCIHETDGTVVKLIGDAIFAVWNAPQPQERHEEKACRAALALQRQIGEFNQQTGVPPMRTRVGLHTGDACVGNVGSAFHFDYTAMGESVNLASRLEQLNKTLGTHILATRECLKGLDDIVVNRTVGWFRLKGFDRVVEVRELLGENNDLQIDPAWLDRFGQGLHQFQHREFSEAKRSFQEVKRLQPSDGPSSFYLNQLKTIRDASLPEDWAGEITLTEGSSVPGILDSGTTMFFRF